MEEKKYTTLKQVADLNDFISNRNRKFGSIVTLVKTGGVGTLSPVGVEMRVHAVCKNKEEVEMLSTHIEATSKILQDRYSDVIGRYVKIGVY